MNKIGKRVGVLKNLITNLGRMLKLAWETDKWLTISYYLAAVVGSLMPIGAGVASKYLIDYLINNQGKIGEIFGLAMALVVMRLLLPLGETLSYWVLNVSYFDYLFRSKLQNEINYRFYGKMASLDAAYFEDPKTQNLITKTKDTKTWKLPDVIRGLSYTTRSATMAIGAAGVLIGYGWWVPVVVVLACIPRLISQAKQGDVQWSIYGSGAPKARRLWYFEWLLSEPVVLKEVKIFQSGEYLLGKLKQTQNDLFQIYRKSLDDFVRLWLALPFLETAVLVVVAYVKMGEVVTGAMTVGGMALFLEMLLYLKGNIVETAVNLGWLYGNNLYVNDFNRVMELPDLIEESLKPKKIEVNRPPKIEFRNVGFKYPGGKRRVLEKINMVIEPGKNVALVGINGAGKTTIIKLLCRFYDVTEGEILINGINIKEIAKNDLYQLMGTLFQEFAHYHFTVKENITMGDPTKKSRTAMVVAAKQAGADGFIGELPDKYDQLLGREFDDGEDISGGQWQKLAIARAFYEQAPLLILDEPTSAIDAEAEFEIFTNLQQVYREKTLVLVSHRFSTVRNADVIYVIEDGKVSESGSHQELLARGGKYASMFQAQAKGYK